MDLTIVLDVLTIILSLGGSYFISQYRRKVGKREDFVHLSDDGRHSHSFNHVYADGKWRCGVVTEDGICEHVKDFE